MEAQTPNRREIGAFFSKYGIYFAFVLLAGALAIWSPAFRTLGNLENILQQITQKEFQFLEIVGGFFGLLIGIIQVIIAILLK